MFFLEKYQKKNAKSIKGFDKGSIELLSEYDWPGNIRELENVIERAVILCGKDKITSDDFVIPSKPALNDQGEFPQLKDIEKEYILKVLENTDWNKSKASKLLGLDRKTLYHKLKKYGLET